jgi:hypothetical protein
MLPQDSLQRAKQNTRSTKQPREKMKKKKKKKKRNTCRSFIRKNNFNQDVDLLRTIKEISKIHNKKKHTVRPLN